MATDGQGTSNLPRAAATDQLRGIAQLSVQPKERLLLNQRRNQR